MPWITILGIIVIWYNFPFISTGSSGRQGYKINPKPCWVDSQEGTCMFVYECIKSEGVHIGMCVDAFMFGSCCAHNHVENTAAPNKLQILYTSPSHSSTKKPVKTSLHYHSTNSRTKPTSLPTRHNSTLLTSQGNKPLSGPAPMSLKPSYYTLRQSTQPPRHSLRPMSTDPFALSNNILIEYTKPDNKQRPTTESVMSKPLKIKPVASANWQLTTEPDFITRIKKPSSFKPKPNKPTKKPYQNNNNKYSLKPIKIVTTTTTSTERIMPARINSTSDNDQFTLDDNLLETSTLNTLLQDQFLHKSDCGIPKLFTKAQTRIVGGKNAVFGRWPWQVSVRRTSFFGFSSTHRCGGAILNELWIVTAGHCVDDLLLSQIRIRVGEFDFSNAQEELPYVERAVAKKVVHPKYNFSTYEYDLALVQLDKAIDFAPHILPICLPASDDLLIGYNATVTGWGRLSEGGTLPSILQEVQVPIVSNAQCKTMFLKAGRHEYIPEVFLCAGHEFGGQDSCQGDSGGPLQVKGKDGRYFLAGIISWGIGCAEANLPGVCTRISKFVPWILKYLT